MEGRRREEVQGEGVGGSGRRMEDVHEEGGENEGGRERYRVMEGRKREEVQGEGWENEGRGTRRGMGELQWELVGREG